MNPLDHYVETVPPVQGVVAVIPAYNEERFIASVVITTLLYAERVIVVDDGSHDRTAMVAEAAGADVISMSQNGGKGLALNAGFQRARELRPRVVVMLDGDAQHNPAEIPNLVAPIIQGEADVVVGSRFLETKSDIPKWRQMGQHALTLATNKASHTRMTDSQSGFRAFSLLALKQMHFQSGGLAVESEMQFLLERSTLRVAEAPISCLYLDGNKRNPIVHGLQVLDAILSLVARRRPLMFLGVPGMMLTIAGFLVGLFVVQWTQDHHVVPIGTAMVSVFLMTSGLLLSVAAVILNSLEHFMRRMRSEMQELLRAPGHSVGETNVEMVV